MARIGERDKVIDQCLSLLIGAKGNSKILYVGGSLFAIGAHRQTALYYLLRLRVSCLFALAIGIRGNGKADFVAGSAMSVCRPN